MTARTETEIFTEFRSGHVEDGNRWVDHWRQRWMAEVDFWYSQGWYVIPLAKYSKRPLAGYRWSELGGLPKEQTLYYAGAGYNFAVMAGPSRLVILDYDSDSGAPFDTGTLTMRTPKGYQYWCRMPGVGSDLWFAKWGESLRKVGFDTPRAGAMYALVPLSRTCSRDRGGRCDCHPHAHDFRIREWVEPRAPVLPFRTVVKRLTT